VDSRYLIVTDLETTGLNEDKHEIIQIAREVVDLQTRSRMPDGNMSCYVIPTHWDKREKEAMEVNKLERWFLQTNGESLWEALRRYSVGMPWDNASMASWGDLENKFLPKAFVSTNRPIPYNHRTTDIRSYAWLKQVETYRDINYAGLTEVAERLGIMVEAQLLHDAAYDVWLTSEVLIRLLGGESGT